jgi:hypothetical protein
LKMDRGGLEPPTSPSLGVSLAKGLDAFKAVSYQTRLPARPVEVQIHGINTFD